MGSLVGFRPPQFSEDGAWLPCWLQQEDNEVETSDEGLERGQSPSEQCVEEYHNLQKNISNVSAGQLSGEEDGYKSCHLYLSGDDGSLLSFTPSIDNVVHFHLHLSLGCNSEDMANPSIDTFQVERNKINCDINVQHFEVSGEPEVKANQLYMEHNIDVITCSLVPELGGTDEGKRIKGLEENARLLEVEQMQDVLEASQINVDHNIGIINCSLVPECDGTDKDKSSKVLEENTRLLEVEQMNDAVEMSISASEALVIHEVLRTMSFSKSLPAAAVLEAALQVKQARLEVWKESNETCCNRLTKEISESDFQLESEDLNMGDTDHDVGLSASQYSLQGDHLTVSQVKDTLDSENCGYDGKSKSEEVLPPNISHLQHSDNFVNQKLEDVRENDLQLKQSIVIESSHNDWQNKVINESMGLDTTSISCDNNPMLHLLGQTVEHNPKEDHSLQATVESPIAKSFEIAGQYYGVSNTVPSRFQSRWFGGWTGDTSFSIPVGYNNSKIIAEPFVRETSYFSESADIAPDENSFVGLKHDERANFASQSTIPSEGLYMEGNNRVFPSQDVYRSSSPFFVDPLCSVVPCSIPSQNMPSPSALCDEQVNMETCFIPGTENVIENLQSNSNLDNKALPEQFSISEASADRLERPVRRKLTSLRSLSMIMPRNGPLLEKGSLNKTFLLERSDTLQYLSRQNVYGSANNAHELPSGLQEETNSRLMSKSMTKGPVQHSNHFPSDFTAEANRRPMEGSETLSGITPNLNLLKLHSIHENQNTASLGTRKRVRFAETETKAPRREKQQKQQITSNTRHTMRAAKCLTLSNSESRAQNLKGCLTNCQANFGKKLLFQSMKFLLTGFPKQKEKRIEGLIRKYGGTVLSDIPSENQRKRGSRLRAQEFPVVLCSKKLQTMKFLYGCAVGAMMVKAKWLTDSIAASSLLPPEQYMILQKSVGQGYMQAEIPVEHNSSNSIFDGVGIMLHGAKQFCTEMAKIVKHGGAKVFKTLQSLVLSLDTAKITVGVVVTEDGSWASRHLKQCTLEKKIPIMPVNWIVNSLHAQKLLPYTEKEDTLYSRPVKLPDTSSSIEWSQEI